MPITAGTPSDRVIIEEVTRAQNAYGSVEVWTQREKRWARVIPFIVVPIRFRGDTHEFHQEVSRANFKVIFRGAVGLSMGDNRIIYAGNRILYPLRSEIMRGGRRHNKTSVFCREEPDEVYEATS